jgi:hypothetical protein
MLQPFIYGGAAWRHYDVTNTRFNTSDLASSDNVFELPLGIGIAGYYYSGFMLDIRGEYRWAWGNDLLNTPNGESVSMNRWGAMANLGHEF